MNIAIIPARGGSKRLPRKNILELAGKPMIAWTIEAAVKSNVFDYVFVSTDDVEIATISKKYGAIIPFLRPEHLSMDNSTTDDVVVHLVAWFEENHKNTVKNVAILQPTSPLRNARNIQDAMMLMKEKNAKAIVSVCELEHPIQFCNILGENNSLEGFIQAGEIKRSQDYAVNYRLNGAIYLIDRCYVGRLGEIYSANSYAYKMSASESIDIDTVDDFKLAEFFNA